MFVKNALLEEDFQDPKIRLEDLLTIFVVTVQEGAEAVMIGGTVNDALSCSTSHPIRLNVKLLCCSGSF